MNTKITQEGLLNPDEEKLLTALGYLVMRWNYAEYFARQILRKNLAEDSLFDEGHMKISRQSAGHIEDALRKLALPNWQNPGRKFLEGLIEAYSSGRQHRNHIVHGIWSTAPQRGHWPAQAILIYAKPHDGKLWHPSNIELDKLVATANHFHKLAMFAREVALTFDGEGSVAKDSDGSPIMHKFPEIISPLPEVERIEITEAMARSEQLPKEAGDGFDINTL